MYEDPFHAAVAKATDAEHAEAMARRAEASEAARAAMVTHTIPADELARRRNRPSLDDIVDAYLNPNPSGDAA